MQLFLVLSPFQIQTLMTRRLKPLCLPYSSYLLLRHTPSDLFLEFLTVNKSSIVFRQLSKSYAVVTSYPAHSHCYENHTVPPRPCPRTAQGNNSGCNWEIDDPALRQDPSPGPPSPCESPGPRRWHDCVRIPKVTKLFTMPIGPHMTDFSSGPLFNNNLQFLRG